MAVLYRWRPLTIILMQNPGLRDVLREVAECASAYSINLEGRVRRHSALIRGGCATVHQGMLEPEGTMVAVKTVIISGNIQQLDTYKMDIKKALREVHTWSKLSHQNVLPLLGITTDFDYTISMVSAWMDNGNAHDHVQNLEVDPCPLLHDIARGLHYLHTHERGAIFHGDLKGHNVLISPEGRALLTDFGFSRGINSSFSISRPLSGVGTLRWMVPEILDGGELSHAGDVWAFGMTCLELFTRKVPFPKCPSVHAVKCAILKGPDRPSLDETLSRLTDCWWSLCSSCWEFDRISRLSISDVVNRISYILDPKLEIYGIELQDAKEVKFVELKISGRPHTVPRQREGAVFRAEFSPPLRPGPEEFSLFITYKKSGRQPDKLIFDPFDVHSNSEDHKFCKKIGKINNVLTLAKTSSTPGNEFLEELGQIPRFRVLVMGKSGVGKTTLINHAFGIKNAFAEHDKRGWTDIKKELISGQNSRLILHDNKSFEQGEDDSLAVVTQFIKERRDIEDIEEQLHAVWLCFQIPNTEAGQRMEAGMEEFLQQKKEILGDVPTIFVFTRYDVLTTAVESTLMESVEDYTSADVELKAKQFVEERCVEPVKKLTKETSIPHIAVSTAHRDKLEELIRLTYEKVSEYFGNKPGVPGASTVPTSLLMAQRVAPHLNPHLNLKIERSIRVGKEKYWQATFAGAVFTRRSIQDCLRVIHDDIIRLWNFRDEDELLQSKEFREFMVNLVDLLDRHMDRPPSPQRSGTMSSILAEGASLVTLLPITLPLAAVQWAHNLYNQMPEVQRKFIAYIVDLINVLDILFILTASRREKNLNIRAIKGAYKTYYESMRRVQVHARIRGCSVSIFRSSSAIISTVESLVRQRYVIDEELTKKIGEVSAGNLEGYEPWYL